MSNTTVGIYLTFDGNCQEAFDFYKGVFGGEFKSRMTYGDSPMKTMVDEDFHGKILHMSLEIGKMKFSLMGCDYNPAIMKHKHKVGNNVSLALTPGTDRKEADRLFAGLMKDGGTENMKMEDQFWDSYFGTLTDKFGVDWMIDCPKTIPASEEGAKGVANALRKAADLANAEADRIEKAAKKEEPPSKKAKLENGTAKATNGVTNGGTAATGVTAGAN